VLLALALLGAVAVVVPVLWMVVHLRVVWVP
jgi:hypothetical protein